ncbi:protein PHLOEM PROTEIN 2-LIKE A10-like [Phragmites australis]|uniref:protein PHLOEM PROTEIN 2-LIKE A10-like n=1 Tax=Phragmites australis TaxID=29695 RepID=UPI002D781397|nr:protein PHLOEM PROTEIN 2-LIKE A10-like [Phragmites australis]XP_062201390.1 protein PHLOEM PROTEIN 2-LIKE A10-like [Phragmites australis]
MDALAAACLCSRRRRARRLLLAAAAATAGYGLYRLYRHHRRRLIAALTLADAVSLVGSDLADFLRSDSDQVPRSLLQLSKLAASEPISSAASSLSESVASGVLRAISTHRQLQQQQLQNPQTPLQDRILDRLLSPAGAGFASAVVGSFARNLVLSSCHARTAEAGAREEPEWLAALCSARGKEAAAELVRVFVSTAVAAYLDRTVAVRSSDQVSAGLSDPKHEAKVKDLAVSVCNGAVETFLRTSRQLAKEASVARTEAATMEPKAPNSDTNYVMQRVSSTLAMPSNRRFVLDVTGRVTAETVRSFLDFLAQRVSDGARKSIVIARDEVAERGLVAVKYLGAKSMAVLTISLALCMHILMGTRFLLPA